MSDSALLNIEVKADGVDKAKRSLADLAEQGGKTERSMSGISKSATNTNSALSSMAVSVKGLIGAYAGLAGVVGFAKISDEYTKFNAQLKIATGSQREFNQALKDVNAIAAATQSSISTVSTLYSRLNNSLKDIGVNQADVARITETVGLSLKVAGSSAEEASSAMLQLSQAFGSGVLRGEEFNSLMEASPNLMRALAESIGVPIGKLRDMAAEGQLTADVLTKAFTDDTLLTKLRAQAKEINTVSGSFQLLRNEFVLTTGQIAKDTGSITVLTTAMSGLADALKRVRENIPTGGEVLNVAKVLPFSGSTGLGVLKDAAIATARLRLNYGNASGDIANNIRKNNALNGNNIAGNNAITGGASPFPNFNSTVETINVDELHKQQEAQNRLLKEANSLADERTRQIDNFRESTLKSIEVIKQENLLLAQGIPAQDAKTIAQLKANGATDAMIVSTLNAQQANEKLLETYKFEQDFYDSFENSIVSQGEALDAQVESIRASAIALEDENASYGKLPSAITDVTIARLEDKQAMLEGLGLVVPEIEAQIQAYKRLKAAQFSKEDLDRNKKAEDDRVTAAKKSADEIAKAYEKAADDINKSITDALLRGFESGKSFAKNFRDTLINMFKTLVLRPIINMVVNPIGGAVTTALGSIFSSSTASASTGASSSGLGSLVQGGKSIFDLIGNGNASIVGGIESIGASIANGLGGIRDSIGGFIGANSSAIADGFGYAGALIALSQGKIATSIGAGIGTFLGGTIGGAIGSVLGGFVDKLFGGGDKSPRLVTRVSSSYSNGTFNAGGGVNSFDGSNGTASNQASLQEAFAKSLGMLLKGFGLSDAVTTSSMLYKKRGTGAGFDASFDGGSVKTIEWSKSGDLNAIFQRMVDTVLGKTIVEAIQKTKLSDGIKALFNGLTDKTQVSNMLTASINLNNAQEQLAKRFGLTVDQAAKVSVATGLAGDSLSTFANTLASSASAFNTVGDVLVKAKAQLKANLGFEVPDSFNAFDLALKNIDKTTQAGIESFIEMFNLREQFAAFTLTLDNLKGGVKGALFSIVSDTEKQAMLNTDLSKAFGDLGLSVPTSIQELISLGKSIDFTTKNGLDLAAVFPSLVTAFNQTQTAVDSLMNSLRDVNEFTTLVDFKRYKGLATNYGNSFANSYVDGMSVTASNSVNTPVATSIVQPSNNTTISTSDPNLLQAIVTLTAQVQALQASADKTATHSKRAADVLVNVSPNGNVIQTEVYVP